MSGASLRVPTTRDEGTRCRRRVHSRCANGRKVSIKGFEKFQKQFCTLRHATRNNDRDLAGASVPFEGTDLPVIARSWTRGSARVSGEAFRANERIFREIEKRRSICVFLKRTTPRNYPVLWASFKISSIRLRPRRVHNHANIFVSIAIIMSRVVVDIAE